MHLNRNKTQEIHRNILRNFPLHGFNKHLPWFRCSEKWEHLNLVSRQNPVLNQLTTNVLQDFQQLHPWFRSQPGLECRGMQIRPGGTSGRGIHQTRSRTAHASEPEQNSKNRLQHIEKLSIVRLHQESPLVQMQSGRKKAKNHFSSRYNTLDICASLTCHFSLSSYAIFILSLSDNST